MSGRKLSLQRDPDTHELVIRSARGGLLNGHLTLDEDQLLDLSQLLTEALDLAPGERSTKRRD